MKTDIKATLLVVIAFTTLVLLAFGPAEGVNPAESLVKALINVVGIVVYVLVVLIEVIFVVLNVAMNIIGAI